MKTVLTCCLVSLGSLCFAQNQKQQMEMKRPQEKPGITMVIDIRSDSLFLASFIGAFRENDVVRLKLFLNSVYVEKNRNKDQYEIYNGAIMDSLERIVPIEKCKASNFKGYTRPDYGTKLDKEVITPLLKLVQENDAGICGGVIMHIRE